MHNSKALVFIYLFTFFLPFGGHSHNTNRRLGTRLSKYNSIFVLNHYPSTRSAQHHIITDFPYDVIYWPHAHPVYDCPPVLLGTRDRVLAAESAIQSSFERRCNIRSKSYRFKESLECILCTE